MGKIRLDTLIFTKGIAKSREKARAFVLAGEVWVDGVNVTKPGTAVCTGADIKIVSSKARYVSRGGFKLEKAISAFGLDFNGRVVVDIGASTGGYTDCALQNGAHKVYAIDVGYGQLDWSLRNDQRVVCLERTNIRYFSKEAIKENIDIITMDVSFISVTKIFPVIKDFINENGQIVSLIKPQFEAGRNQVGKKGVVSDKDIHRQVLLNCIAGAERSGLVCYGITHSPIKGPKGNIEFFIGLKKALEPLEDIKDLVYKAVENAHNELGG